MLLYRNRWGICNLIKKILPIILIILLVLSGINFTTISADKKIVKKSVTKLAFSKPTLVENKEYVSVSMEETDSFLMETGKPMMPKSVKTFELEFGARNINVEVTTGNIREYEIEKEIRPAPVPMPLATIGTRAIMKNKAVENLKKEDAVYSSKKLFPSDWYSYNVGVGLNAAGKRVTRVAVHVFPVRYAPAIDKLYVAENVDIKITYGEPETASFLENGGNGYDLMIIAPEDFSKKLQPLINHKNNHGVKTFLKTTEEIYAEFSGRGRDKPEQIKYAIRDAIETRGVKYVLLLGGLRSYLYANDKDDCNQGSTAWHVPVRYANIEQFDEGGCISDLYYADIYKYNKTSEKYEFDDWDSNGNGIFAEWTEFKKDTLDLYPDVYVGRLACRNTREVKIMVSKIINYEETSPDSKPWFKKMIGIGGKTFDLYEGQPDGEYVCDMSLDYMGDLIDEPVRVYASNRDSGGLVPVPKDIINVISKGAGYVDFQGHGSPIVWDTIWHDGEYPEDWVGGINLYNFWRFSNGEKLPVVIVGGCHNGLFNVTLIKTLLDRKKPYTHWTGGIPAHVCFSWGLCVVPRGGAIASTGCTGYGIGYEDQPLSLSAELESNFFYQIGQSGVTTLGNAHSDAIRKFIDENTVGQTEVFCITEYQLFGDPSLKLGGYPDQN